MLNAMTTEEHRLFGTLCNIGERAKRERGMENAWMIYPEYDFDDYGEELIELLWSLARKFVIGAEFCWSGEKRTRCTKVVISHAPDKANFDYRV